MKVDHTKIPTIPEVVSDPRYLAVAKLLKALNKKWAPHRGQKEVGRMLFQEGKRRIFCENGRKWGKTEWAIDLCWRLGNMIQNGQIYYFGNFQKNVRETIWENGRLKNHGPQEYLAKPPNNTEMRLTYKSGTFVKCDGADEFNVGRGFNPDVVICDEFAQFRDAFWGAMSPNFVPKDTIVIVIGTPPEQLESEPGKPVLFCRVADLWKKRMEDGREENKYSKYGYVNHPSFVNERIDPEIIQSEINDLIDMGLEDQAEREFYAKRVRYGGGRIIPTFDKDKHVHGHDWLMKEKILGDVNQLEWYTICDPGESSVFGTLIMAVNRYKMEVYFLDEIYEKDEREMMVELLWPRIQIKENELYPSGDSERFLRVYDEAAKMFSTEMINRFEVAFLPTEKAVNSVVDGVSLLRTVFHSGAAYVSDRCSWFAWELENWRKDDRGNYPRKDDHLIDCARYGLHAADFVMLKSVQEQREKDLYPFLEKREGLDEAATELLEELDGYESIEGDYTWH